MSNTDGIHITREQLTDIVRTEAARLVADRIASMPPGELMPQLDWMPASWFAARFNLEVKAFSRLAKKFRIPVASWSTKTRLYSVTAVNKVSSERAFVAAPRKRANVVEFSKS